MEREAVQFIFGEIFSLLGACCVAYSTFCSAKRSMVLWQMADSVASVITNLLLGSYAASSTCAVAAVRNILIAKNRCGRGMTVLFAGIIGIVGILTNNRGAIGLLAIVANVQYSLCVGFLKKPQSLRWALAVTLVFWVIHDTLVRSYPMAVMNFISMLVTLWNIRKAAGGKEAQ